MPNTYTNINDALNQQVYANDVVSKYKVADASATYWLGDAPAGTLLQTIGAYVPTNEVAQENGAPVLPYLMTYDAQGNKTFFLFGENLFYLNNGSYVSAKQPTTANLPSNDFYTGNGGGLLQTNGGNGGNGGNASSGSGGSGNGTGTGTGGTNGTGNPSGLGLGLFNSNIPWWVWALIGVGVFAVLTKNNSNNGKQQ